MNRKQIMIIAGEASGDLHGANLAQSIKKRNKDIQLFGVGGPSMSEQGVRLLVDAHSLSVVGITEVLSKLRVIWRSLSIVKRALKEKRPDLLILIDFPDFNFLVAAAAKKRQIPVLYYISPQIWAWRQSRVKRIRRLVDHMAVIFPFETSFYRKHHVPVTFVGHPLLDQIPPAHRTASIEGVSEAPVVGLIPGSREKEINTLLPVMLESAVLIKRQMPETRFLVSCARSIPETLISEVSQPYRSCLAPEIVQGPASRVFKQSHLLVAASGTVTLEAALHCLPMVIVYRVSPLSYQLGKRLIQVKFIGIANLIAQKELLPELIQDDASPQNISKTIIEMLGNPDKIRQIKDELLGIREKLGGPGASDRVAAIAMQLMR
jgi:lipid-A-disaccharide synthase